MNEQVMARIGVFCSHFGLQPGDLMIKSFPMGLNGAGGVGTEIILGSNNPSKPEGRVKIDPAGNFIVFNSVEPTTLNETVVFKQVASFIEANRATHERQTLMLTEKLNRRGGWLPGSA